MKFSRRTLISGIAASTAIGALPNHTAASHNSALADRRFPYVQIDVFTSQRLAGNQLVVFTDARGLTDAEMLALARETTLQETTFVFPRDTATERRDGIKVRIFSPTGELPFAGHPTLGTAAVLRMQSQHPGAPPSFSEGGSSTVILDLKAGKIPVAFRDDATGAFGEMTQLNPVFGKTHDRTQVAQLIGLHPDDLDPDLPIQTVSTGLPFAIVLIRTLKALQSLHPDFDKIEAYLSGAPPSPSEGGSSTGVGENAVDFHYITRETGDPKVRLRARNIDRIGEDPATGSASGCTAAWMVLHGVTKPDEQVLIRQGIEAHRPSDLFVRASKTADRIHSVRVGGYSVKVMEGTLLL
jgi:trans-2,3-dihydro-3-hydroxyanthranilate isomerase